VALNILDFPVIKEEELCSMKEPTLYLQRALACCCLVSGGIAGCSSGQVPGDASLSISPEERVISVMENLDSEGRCRFDPNRHVDIPMVLNLRDGQGSPIGNAEISVYVNFAANTFSGYPALALYDDTNSNGVVDDDELISGVDDDIARVVTKEYAGDHMLLLRVNLSCAYRGTVFAFVDGANASAFVEIRAEQDASPPSDDGLART